LLDQLALGLGQIATVSNLLVLLLGLVIGMLVAILPGLTLVMGVALALPFTYAMGMIPAVISSRAASPKRALSGAAYCCSR
jgi:putative tricarboxylic transport membrane protein